MRYGLGDLGDLYRDRMTLRQLWVRLRELPYESGFHAAIRKDHEDAEEQRVQTELDDVLDRYRKG